MVVVKLTLSDEMMSALSADAVVRSMSIDERVHALVVANYERQDRFKRVTILKAIRASNVDLMGRVIYLADLEGRGKDVKPDQYEVRALHEAYRLYGSWAGVLDALRDGDV